MGYEFNEMNLVLMHKEVDLVFQVATKSNLPTALNMLKISKVVMKHKAQSEEDNVTNDQSSQDMPSTSMTPASPVANVTKSVKSPRSKPKKQQKVMSMVSVATQTAKEVITVNLAADEEEFTMIDLHSMRQNYLINTIRQQDFDE